MEDKTQKEINEKDFAEANKRFDQMQQRKKSNIKLKNTMKMVISDVEVGDAMWWKGYCDRHFDGKQFIGIKYIRNVVQLVEPLINNVVIQINNQEKRIAQLEFELTKEKDDKIEQEEEETLNIPKTQGGNKK